MTDADRAEVEELWDRYIDEVVATEGEAFRDSLRGLASELQYPETKAFWTRPLVDDAGWLWLPIPRASTNMSLAGVAPIRARPRLRIVDARGEFVGVTEWPPEALLPEQSGIVRGHLLTMVWDDDAEEILPTVYRIRPAVDGLT